MQSRRTARSTARPLGAIRLAVVFAVVFAALLGTIGFVDSFRAYDARADHYSSLRYLDLVYGIQRSPELWPARHVIEDALATMPEDAPYRVAFGPGWRPGQVRWTNEFTAGFLRYFLLPRTESDSSATPWVFCFGCDESRLGGRFRVLAESGDGFRFGRVER